MAQDAVSDALLNGDSAAWASFVRRYGGLIVAAVRGIALMQGDIEDLTQEIFLRVFVRLPVLRDPSALRAFVLSVAMNVLKWELRRRWVGLHKACMLTALTVSWAVILFIVVVVLAKALRIFG